MEEYLPIFSMVIQRLESDPEWAIDLLEISTEKFFREVYRRRRDMATEPLAAIEAGFEIVKRWSSDSSDHLALAHLLARADRQHEALHVTEKAIADTGASAELYRLHASLLERTGSTMQAEEAIGRALDIFPDDEELRTESDRIERNVMERLYKTRDMSQDFPDAIAAGKQIINRRPDDAGAKRALAHILARSERLDEALELIDQVISTEGESIEDYRLQASLLERLTRFGDAESVIKRAHFLAPEDEHVRTDLNRISSGHVTFLRQSRDALLDTEKSILAGLEVISRCPEEMADAIAVARLLQRSARPEEAVRLLDRFSTESGATVEYHRLRACLFAETGRFREAYKAAKTASALDVANHQLI
ncbi:tetratricopeptide repeat protein [Burkholderia sp. Bp9015]|uniref:tetratricopeptide repeat protein n=1 Tax=Burkholderia sp. Bp9015 TaxID=2184563 RepID=UPI0016237AA9|nr:tetratricopeptide repeat protein [Burkholderia sp. Bp9015]